MSILKISPPLGSGTVGLVGVSPSFIYINTDDSLATVMSVGYLNNLRQQGYIFSPTQSALVNTIDGVSLLAINISGLNVSLVQLTAPVIPGNVTAILPTVSGNIPIFYNVNGDIQDSAVNLSSFMGNLIYKSSTGGQTINYSQPSATPTFSSSLNTVTTSTASTLTSGELSGITGETQALDISGGSVFGVHGKITLNGSQSGTGRVAGVYGELNLASSTISGIEIAPLFGDFGTSALPTVDSQKMYGCAITNFTGQTIHCQDFRLGNSEFYLAVDGDGPVPDYYITSGVSVGSAGNIAGCNAQHVFKILINGAECYIPIFSQNT